MASENPAPESSMTDAPDYQEFTSRKIAAGICGIVVGGLGIHKFILGYNTAGIIMLVVSLICFVLGACLVFPWFGNLVMSAIGLAEGILYLTKSDEDFYNTYGAHKKEWF